MEVAADRCQKFLSTAEADKMTDQQVLDRIDQIMTEMWCKKHSLIVPPAPATTDCLISPGPAREGPMDPGKPAPPIAPQPNPGDRVTLPTCEGEADGKVVAMTPGSVWPIICVDAARGKHPPAMVDDIIIVKPEDIWIWEPALGSSAGIKARHDLYLFKKHARSLLMRSLQLAPKKTAKRWRNILALLEPPVRVDIQLIVPCEFCGAYRPAFRCSFCGQGAVEDRRVAKCRSCGEINNGSSNIDSWETSGMPAPACCAKYKAVYRTERWWYRIGHDKGHDEGWRLGIRLGSCALLFFAWLSASYHSSAHSSVFQVLCSMGKSPLVYFGLSGLFIASFWSK